jgi:hypothetical protein
MDVVGRNDGQGRGEDRDELLLMMMPLNLISISVLLHRHMHTSSERILSPGEIPSGLERGHELARTDHSQFGSHHAQIVSVGTRFAHGQMSREGWQECGVLLGILFGQDDGAG